MSVYKSGVSMRSPGACHHDVFRSDTPINTLYTTLFYDHFKICHLIYDLFFQMMHFYVSVYVYVSSIKQTFYLHCKLAPVIGITPEITQELDVHHVII